MSRRNPSPGEVLIQAPWQVSAALAVAVFVGLRWVLPAVTKTDVFTAAVVSAAVRLAWLPSLILGMFAVISAVLAKRKRALLDRQENLTTLRELDWQQFEWLVGEAYRRQGYAVEESLGGGPDGGIDLILRKGGGTWLVQCKQWRSQSVGAPVIREIFGLVTHHQSTGAIIITSGHFSREAVAFTEGKPLELIDGEALLSLVRSVRASGAPLNAPGTAKKEKTKPETSVPILTRPACPRCGAAMVLRRAKQGPNAGNSFWGCSGYPKCRGLVNL